MIDLDELERMEHAALAAGAPTVSRLIAEVRRLRKVAEYACHRPSCDAHVPATPWHREAGSDCTCGLDAARKGDR